MTPLRLPSLIVIYALLFSQPLFGGVALIIIDMQPDFVDRTDSKDLPNNQVILQRLYARQRTLIRIAKRNGRPIVLIEFRRHGDTYSILRDELKGYEKTATFIKRTNGMFNPGGGVAVDLKAYLNSNGVTDLVIAGANGGACVKCSISGAIEQDYKVWADARGIADFNDTDYVSPYIYEDGEISLSTRDIQGRFFQPLKSRVINTILKTDGLPNQVENPPCPVLEHSAAFLPFK